MLCLGSWQSLLRVVQGTQSFKAYESALSIFIWYIRLYISFFLTVYFSDSNFRILPLPRGYPQALTSVIKSMLNLNVSVTQFLTDHRYQLRL